MPRQSLPQPAIRTMRPGSRASRRRALKFSADDLPDLPIPLAVLAKFNYTPYFLSSFQDNKGRRAGKMHVLGQLVDRFSMMVHHDDAELVGGEGSGIQQGIKFWQQGLGVLTPGPAKYNELYLRPFCFQNGYGF